MAPRAQRTMNAMTEQNFTMDRDPTQGVRPQPRTLVTVDLELSYAPDLAAVEDSVRVLLEALEARGTRATFFVQGELAEALPDILRKVLDSGHEIASHGHVHAPIGDWSFQQLHDDIARSQEQLAECGAVVAGYRAPFFSTSPHLDEVLARLEFQWSSSTPRIWFPGRYDHRAVAETPWTTAHGLLEVPVARVHPLVPFGLEHMRAMGPLYPAARPSCDAVFYMHSYSFSDRYQRPLYNRWNTVKRNLALLDSVITPERSQRLSDWLPQAVPVNASGQDGPPAATPADRATRPPEGIATPWEDTARPLSTPYRSTTPS